MKSPITLTGKKSGKSITQIAFADCNADTSNETIVISPDKLKAALWEPEVDDSPESPEEWGGWHWSFKLEDGTQAALSNDRRGGANWTLWVTDTADTQKVLDVLLDVIAASGFRASTRGF